MTTEFRRIRHFDHAEMSRGAPEGVSHGVLLGAYAGRAVNRKRWSSRLELAKAMFDYLEIFRNRQRRRSSLGMLSPIEFERRHANNAVRDQAS